MAKSDAAPVVQLLLTVQFQPPAAALTILDLAEIRGLFPEYATFTQTQRAGPMPVQPAAPIIELGLGLSLPRIQLTTEDLGWMVLFQEDRVSVGWNRIIPLGTPSGYPGFEEVFVRLQGSLFRVLRHLASKQMGEFCATVGEISYTNAFFLQLEESGRAKLGNVFALINSQDDFTFNGYNLSFTKLLGKNYPAHAEISMSGPNPSPTGEPIAHLQTTVRFAIDGTDPSALSDRFHDAHQTSRDLFSTLVKPSVFAISDGQ